LARDTAALAGQVLREAGLRNRSRDILLAIANDMETAQSGSERFGKPKRMTLPFGSPESAASAHGALRHLAGFDLTQLVAEFRAMRARVLAMWRRSEPQIDGPAAIEEIARFNEGIDQALAESVERYSTDVSTFLAVIGHDLRSPLWAIQGTTELLADPRLPEPSRVDTLQRVGRSARRRQPDLPDFPAGHELANRLERLRYATDCNFHPASLSTFNMERNDDGCRGDGCRGASRRVAKTQLSFPLRGR
jgi:signal transduction histidine kinase